MDFRLNRKKKMMLKKVIQNELNSEKFKKINKNKIHDFIINKPDQFNENIDRILGVNALLLINELDDNTLNKEYTRLANKRNTLIPFDDLKKIPNLKQKTKAILERSLFIKDLKNLNASIIAKINNNRLLEMGINKRLLTVKINRVLSPHLNEALLEFEKLDKQKIIKLKEKQVKKARKIIKLKEKQAKKDKEQLKLKEEQVKKDKKIKENLIDENEIIIEELNKAEEKLGKIHIEFKENDVKQKLDDLRQKSNERKKLLDPTEQLRIELPKKEKITESQQRQLAITQLIESNKLSSVQLTRTAKLSIVGSGIIGLAMSSIPYIPKVFNAIKGVPIKKKRTTTEDLILLQQTGINKNNLNQDKRTIDNLNRQLNNQKLQNRQKTINHFNLIQKQNKFNRVNINNIRGKLVHVKNSIKMNNISRRKIFNV
jgi:hypothetical protein